MNFKILKASLTSVALFHLATIVPILGFMLPVYKLKNISKFTLQENIITNLFIILGIGVVSLEYIGIYIIIFLLIELSYYFYGIVLKGKTNLKVFDKMMIVILISTFLSSIYLKFMGEEILEMKKAVEVLYIEHQGMDEATLKLVFNFISDYRYFIMFCYIGIITYMTYLLLGIKFYKTWRFSYQWLILYMIPFYVIKFLKIENLYLINLMMIIKISYIVYCARILYNLIKHKIRIGILNHAIALGLVFFLPNFSFILGGIDSFDSIRIEIKRRKNTDNEGEE